MLSHAVPRFQAFSRTDGLGGKISWGEKHGKFLDEATFLKREISFFGDSLISNFWRKPKLLQFGVEPMNNFGIGRDKIENVLLRIINGEVPRDSKLVIVHNIQRDSTIRIIRGINCICHGIKHSASLVSVCLITICQDAVLA